MGSFHCTPITQIFILSSFCLPPHPEDSLAKLSYARFCQDARLNLNFRKTPNNLFLIEVYPVQCLGYTYTKKYSSVYGVQI